MEKSDVLVHQDQFGDETSYPDQTATKGLERRGEDHIAEISNDLIQESSPVSTIGNSAWDVYNREAKQVDTELVKDWTASLNFLLVFAAIFSAVLTPFIIESKKQLEEDRMELMLKLMIFNANNLANGTHQYFDRPSFEPTSFNITINCLFFASLSTSVVTALASVVALQWVASYDAAVTRGGSSPEDRAKRRQFHYAGIIKWKLPEIIATLPLLLYCSVVLFFIGLAVWMWPLQPTIGWVVAGTTSVVGMFYGLSILCAVAFVDAPFRTPISRVAYHVLHLPIVAMYMLARVIHLANIPTWLQERFIAYRLSHRREDIAVENKRGLSLEALVRLANQLSLSQNSYGQFLHLANELSRLEAFNFTSSIFQDAPWFSIFDLLGWKYIEMVETASLTTQDIHIADVLVQCYCIPEIREIVNPFGISYTTDHTEAGYWSQYCENPSNRWVQEAHPNRPNSLFLLMRDLPIPDEHSSDQLEATLRLSIWRNSLYKAPEHWDRVLDLATKTSLNYFGASVLTLGRFLNARKWDAWSSDADRSSYVDIVDRIVKFMSNGDYSIPTTSLISLLRGFEALLEGEGTSVDPDSCLSRPFAYREALQHSAGQDLRLHHAFTLLLARNLTTCPEEDITRRVKEVITMLWARPLDNIRHNPRESPEISGYGKEIHEIDDGTLASWIKDADTIPGIHEILHHLVTAQAKRPSEVLLLTFPDSQGRNDLLLEAFKTFDRLSTTGVSPSQHRTIIDLVCQHLEISQPPASKDYFVTNDVLKNPCLRVIVSCLGRWDGEYSDLDITQNTELMKDPWDRVAMYLMKHQSQAGSPKAVQVQALLWPVIPNRKLLCQEAMENCETLDYLLRLFEHRVPCSRHYDNTGHILLHIFAGLDPCIFPEDIGDLAPVSIQGHSVDALLTMLLLSYKHKGVLAETPNLPISHQCIDPILEVCSMVTLSQVSFLQLLFDLSIRLIDRRPSIEDVAAMLACINVALQLPTEHGTLSIIPPLARRIIQLKRAILSSEDPAGQHEKVAAEASRVIGILKTKLARISVFGSQNGKRLSCARSQLNCGPAAAWLPIHFE